jgi:hypothetical protein
LQDTLCQLQQLLVNHSVPAAAASLEPHYACKPTHLPLSKERDRLAQRPQHRAHFGIICGHDSAADAPPQLKITQQLLLLLLLPFAGLQDTHNGRPDNGNERAAAVMLLKIAQQLLLLLLLPFAGLRKTHAMDGQTMVMREQLL